MTSFPDIFWPEDGSDDGSVIAHVQSLLGDQPWLVFVPNPRPSKPIAARLAKELCAATLPVGNKIAFVISQTSNGTALRSIFEWGPAEAALMSFGTNPDTAMIAKALASQDAQPAVRLLVFDSNRLQSVV